MDVVADDGYYYLGNVGDFLSVDGAEYTIGRYPSATSFGMTLSDLEDYVSIECRAHPYTGLQVSTDNCTYSLVDATDDLTKVMVGQAIYFDVTPSAGYVLSERYFRTDNCSYRIVSQDSATGVWRVAVTIDDDNPVVVFGATPLVTVTVGGQNVSWSGVSVVGLYNSTTLVFEAQEGYTLQYVSPVIAGGVLNYQNYDDETGRLTIVYTPQALTGCSLTVNASSLRFAPTKATSLTFPESWNPISLITGYWTEYGFGLLDTGYVGMMVQQDVVLTDLEFVYSGVVYNKIRFSFIDVSHGNDGYMYVGTESIMKDQTIYWNPYAESASSRGTRHVIALDSIWFGNTETGLEAQVCEAVQLTQGIESGYAEYPIIHPYTGTMRWIGSSRTIYVLSESGATTGRYGERFVDMSDMDLLILLSHSSGTGYVVVNGGNGDGNWLGSSYDPFALIMSAMDTAVSFMSFTIFPGLTIGLLFTIPVIIGLIILMFKLIKK